MTSEQEVLDAAAQIADEAAFAAFQSEFLSHADVAVLGDDNSNNNYSGNNATTNPNAALLTSSNGGGVGGDEGRRRAVRVAASSASTTTTTAAPPAVAVSSSSLSSTTTTTTTTSSTTTTTTNTSSPSTPQSRKDALALAEYEMYLAKAKSADLSHIEPLGIVYRCGVDRDGLPIVVVVASALPAKSVDLEMVLLLAISVLDPIVEQNYVLVYVHTGLTSDNRPAFAFLSKCYKIFNRKYKKNLKRLYIVHPTFWVRTSFALFRPFLSAKFWRKLVYINDVAELDKTIDRSQITLPRVALEYASGSAAAAAAAAPQQRVMGVPLGELFARASPEPLPPFLEQSLAYLRTSAHVEGILRLSGSILEIKKLAAAVDEGRFDAFANSLNDPHVVGGFVKLWMRELPDPIVSHAFYDKFVVAAREAPPVTPVGAGGDDDEPRADGPSPVTRAVEPVLKQLAAPNRRILAALLDLCGLYHSKRATNLMTARNLGIVMAPNMLSCPGHDMAVTLQNTPLLNETVRWLIIDNKYVVASLTQQ